MNNITMFINNFKSQMGVKGMLKNKLFLSILQGFEAVNSDLESNAAEIAQCREMIGTLTAETEALKRKIDEIVGCIGGSVPALRNDFESACVNLRNNNSALETLSADVELVRLKLNRIEKNGAAAKNAEQNAPASVTVKSEGGSADYECIDYFDFENHFRGSIDSIKKAQEIYLPYFKDKKNVLDIGCGRGEFLSLMKDNGINAKGVDIYEPYVDYCNMKQLNAVCGDGAEYLVQCGEVDGIFLGQVVEHLKIHQIVNICDTAYEKLPRGGCIVIETPNPTSLAIYTNAFYIDPSHVKPVHPMTMKYCIEKAGFEHIEIIYTESSKPPFAIPELKVEGAEEFNESMYKVSELLYGSQDYAIIAVK